MRCNNNEPKSVGKLIGEISRASQIYFTNQFGAYSIGHAQVRSLLFLAKNEGVTQNAISEHFNLDKSSVTSQLKILEENGYIKRERSATDGRSLLISVTEKTKSMLVPIMEVHSGWTEILLGGFDDEEKEQLFSYLERVRDNAAEEVKELRECRHHHGKCLKNREDNNE